MFPHMKPAASRRAARNARVSHASAGLELSRAQDRCAEQLVALRHALRGHRHDVIVFHVQDATELEFDFEGAALFRDMETGEEMEIDPATLRSAYVEKMQELCEFYRKGLSELGVDYHLVNTRQSYDHALTAYLNRRSRH